MRTEIVVTYRNRFFSRFVRWWGIKWTHAAVRYRREDTEPWRVFETAALGTVERDWESFIETVDEWEAYHIKGGLPYLKDEKLNSFAWGNVGKMYNFFRLFYVAIRYLLQGRKPLSFNVNSHICSSFVDACFNHIGVNLVATDDIWVTPDDLIKDGRLELADFYPR